MIDKGDGNKISQKGTLGTLHIDRGVMWQEGLGNVSFTNMKLYSDGIMQYLFSWCFGKKVAKIKWLHLVTEPVLIMPALVATSETADGVYASVSEDHRFRSNSGQYKAVYDYEAQVSFLPQMSEFHIKQMFLFLIVSQGVLIGCFFHPLAGGWALCNLWGCRARHWPRWGRLVDGSKKWPLWIGSRLLPCKRMNSCASHVEACMTTLVLMFYSASSFQIAW